MKRTQLNYLIVVKKDPKHKLILKGDFQGLNITPKNNHTKNQIQVTEMTLISDAVKEQMMKKKINRRFDLLLKEVNTIIIEEDEDDERGLRQVLNEAEKFKAVIKGRYLEYISESFANLVLKKVDILEQEIQMRIYLIDQKKLNEKKQPKSVEEKKGKSR